MLSWPLFLLGGLSLALGTVQAGFVPSVVGALALLAARGLRMGSTQADAAVQGLNAARTC
ncbi:hypothetical protein [Pseudomonas sp. RIT-PI-AD]|uniref:hypothetical protein n=1 Tax=Pseudomonas sp. RIT-PI-AD TaxID=3035294 RepID=UPI0021D887B0|nr:hypothetical protein [Pseudomonas sp. RIT-PI-AD]